MDYNIYLWITTPIIFGVWLYMAFAAIRKYNSIRKMPGMSPFMTTRDIKGIADPKTVDAIKQWKKLTRRLFLTWVLTCFGFLILTMIISRAGWFINEPK
jgi:hypothetical protein